MSQTPAKYFSSCYCRRVKFEALADPVGSKYCHCKVCQRLHGAPFQWAVIFHKKDIHFTQGENDLVYYNSDEMCEGHTLPCKLTCKHCKSPIADEGRNMFLAFGPNFEFGIPPKVPDAFKATCHIFYTYRVVDMKDTLPKYEEHAGKSNLLAGPEKPTDHELPPVLLLGDPRLRVKAVEIVDFQDPQFLLEKQLLIGKLTQFRAENGFGRAIAAPQIGFQKRFIAMKLPSFDCARTIINPQIVKRSESTFTLWDDCMSFPWLMVKVKRHDSIDLEYFNDTGEKIVWKDIERSTAELLQHEIDHLDGVLAIDLATEVISREVFERDKPYFQTLVDYIIS